MLDSMVRLARDEDAGSAELWRLSIKIKMTVRCGPKRWSAAGATAVAQPATLHSLSDWPYYNPAIANSFARQAAQLTSAAGTVVNWAAAAAWQPRGILHNRGPYLRMDESSSHKRSTSSSSCRAPSSTSAV